MFSNLTAHSQKTKPRVFACFRCSTSSCAYLPAMKTTCSASIAMFRKCKVSGICGTFELLQQVPAATSRLQVLMTTSVSSRSQRMLSTSFKQQSFGAWRARCASTGPCLWLSGDGCRLFNSSACWLMKKPKEKQPCRCRRRTGPLCSNARSCSSQTPNCSKCSCRYHGCEMMCAETS